MARVELVFRTVGERTSDLALELAIRHLRPDRVHVLDDVRPFSATVERMLRLPHDGDYVVYVDADCLILEDMRAVIDRETTPYFDSFVSDRFRGRLHCGVHVTRIDVVRAMAEVEVPESDIPYLLRPESRVRNLAMRQLGLRKTFRSFDILHDHFQFYRDIFAKYALRELRSRTPKQRLRLDDAMVRWSRADDDLEIARQAVDYARREVAEGAPAATVGSFIASLPGRTEVELARLGVVEKGKLDPQEVDAFRQRQARPGAFARSRSRPKIFGIGLSRTGTRSLTEALRILGFDVCHYPTDETTFDELANARYDLTRLQDHDAITDITVAPYYAQFDRRYPGAKFILTVREKARWLTSCRNHWLGRPAFSEADTLPYGRMRRLLRAAVYGCYGFDAERFSWAYDLHVKNATEYFAGRPDSLLVVNICDGEAWEPLCRFLDREIPDQRFPHRGDKLSQRLRALEPVR